MKRLALLAVLAVMAWIWWPKTEPPAKSHPIKPTAPATPALVSGRVFPPSLPLAAELNAPAGDPERDVVVLHQLLKMYQRALQNHQGSPIGNDGDLARVLTGRNPIHRVFLPPDHPALAVRGRLVDRWGTPYHLHPRGYGAYEIRSAGPDKKLFTADDFVANPPEQAN